MPYGIIFVPAHAPLFSYSLVLGQHARILWSCISFHSPDIEETANLN